MRQAPLTMFGRDSRPDPWMEIPREPQAPGQSRYAAVSSVLLHVLLLAAILLLPGRLPQRSEPPREPVMTIVPFEPIPEVFVPSAPGQPSGKQGGGGGGARPAAPPAGVAHDLRPPGPERQPSSPAGARAGEERPAAPSVAQESAPTQATSPAGTREPDDTQRGEETSRFDVGKALRDFRPVPARKGSESNTGTPRGGGGLGSIGGLNVPDLPPLPDSGFGFGNLQFESRDYDFSDYARQIYMAIWRAWHNRLYLTVDSFEKWGYENHTAYLEHRSRIRFRIEASGQVTLVSLERTSGCPPLDASAMDALREVVLPPLPSDFPRGQETVHATFLATGDLAAMRPTLRRLKALDFF